MTEYRNLVIKALDEARRCTARPPCADCAARVDELVAERPGLQAAIDRVQRLAVAAQEKAVAHAIAAERERITARFDEWIEIAMSEPNTHPPAAWKVAFRSLVDPEHPGQLARQDGQP